MAIKLGKCRNYGNCDVADLNRIVEAAEGKFVCPECGHKLIEANPKLSTSATRGKPLSLLASVGILVLAGVIGFLVWQYNQPTPVPPPVNPPSPAIEIKPEPAPPTPEPVPVPAKPKPEDPNRNNAKPPSGDETIGIIRDQAGKK